MAVGMSLSLAYFQSKMYFLMTGEIRQNDQQGIAIVKSSERRTATRAFGKLGYIYESVCHKYFDRLMDAYVVTTGFEFPPEPHTHEGEELVYVLEGSQELFYNGKLYEVSAGDCIYFDSTRLHYSRSIGDRPGKVLVVFSSKK
jgi:mannose-6-phosphate isomerase-like protein (cupin superfamily)